MKNTLLAFTFVLFNVLFFSTISMAQDFRLGLTASPSVAWMNPKSDGFSSEGSRIGFSYGLIAEILFSEQYSLASGLQISYVGGILNYPVDETINSGTFNELERTYRLQSIDLPFTLKMRSREMFGIQYFGKIGIGMGLILKAEGDDSFVNTQNNTRVVQSEKDIKDNIAFGRASLIFGGGVEYRIGGNVSLVGGLSFNNGFTNMLKNNNEVSGERNSARVNYLELTIGILF